ncbi:MAG: suppressor of fused domain protein [Caulobacteraceae bacterium]|nr:suppressor of fused domain protein [Caulobacteraceae bacterium]
MDDFIQDDETHFALSKTRLEAFATLFGKPPVRTFTFDELDGDDDSLMIDVLAYAIPQAGPKGQVYALVTNGLSDFPIFDPDEGVTERCEIIQYFYEVREEDAQRLYAVAYLAVMENINLADGDAIAMAGIPDPFERPNSLFLRPLVKSHMRFDITIGGDPTTLLWHVPISDAELEYKMSRDVDALIERMAEAETPWVYDGSRASLV